MFWGGIDPTHQTAGRQYANIIFYHSDEQKRQAEESKQRIEERLKQKTFVEILPCKRFYPAEDYHQKYYLQQAGELMSALRSIYPDKQALFKSTAAARLNAYRGGYLSLSGLRMVLGKLELPPPDLEAVVGAARGAGVLTAH